MTAPLTVLTEEERMFQGAVRDFAESEVRPRVHAMEQAAQLDPTLIPKFFELGLMGIEIPGSHGGAAGSLFMTVLAVEELSAVDASAAIFVDVQNTLVNALLLKWASDDVKQRYLPRLASEVVGAYALSEAGSGSDAFGLQTKATKQGDTLTYDFTGSSPQTELGVNCSYWATWGGLFAPIFPLLAWDVTWNEGVTRPIRLVAPEGTVVNCIRPAPISIATVGTK